MIRWLQNLGKKDVITVGGKAASLGELMRAGFAVPAGFVVTTEAYDRFAATGGVTEEFEREIADAFDELGSLLVAVRSSATVEDAPEASWAGQLDTYLNTDREHLLANIKRCWKSLESSRARAYGHGQEKSAKVAVVVQKMIQSDIAGVVFTANPVTGDREEIVIEWTAGLGDRLVSGQVTPETVTFKKTVLADSSHTMRPLAQTCLQIESCFGYPCDIEWCHDANGYYAVQCRPITTL